MVQKIALIEVPELKVTYELNGTTEVYSAVRNSYPKHSQLIIGGFLRDLVDVQITDMKIHDVEREEQYKAFVYGKGVIKCYRKGMSFDAVNSILQDSWLVGLTSNFTRSSGIVVDFIKHIKKINPHCKVVVGGIDATARFEHYLKNDADIVILGEGEIIGRNVINALLKNRTLSNISGIAYFDSGKIIYNPRQYNKDTVAMDDIPLPAFDLVAQDVPNYIEAFEGPIHPKVKTPLAIFDTSRGCNQACHFCSTPFIIGHYRFMSTKKIEAYLAHYKKHGIKTLLLMEDNILSRLDYPNGRKLLFEFFDLLKQYEFAWEFGNGIEIGKLINGHIDQDLIEKLFYRNETAESLVGCYRVYIPLECLHLHPEVVFRKLKEYEKEKAVIEAIAATGVPMMTIGIIIGRQDDSQETLALTRERCLEIRKLVERYNVSLYFTPFIETLVPGTLNYMRNKDMLVYDMEKFPELYHFHTAAAKTSSFSPEELTLLKRELEEDINGKDARKFWGLTGKYYFNRYEYRL